MEGRHDRGQGGERNEYKSRAEVQIARFLDRYDIAYKYEWPIAVVDHGQTKIWYPDYSLPQYGMIIEYFGLNNDPSYKRRTEHKMRVYRQNGIDGVFLNEASFKGDWPTRILGQIEDVLEKRIDRFRRCRRH